MRKLSIEQKNYMMAQALFETVKAEYQEKYEAVNLDELYEEDFDKAFDLDEEINAAVGYQTKYDLLVKAEKELVEWCFTVVEKEPLYKKVFNDINYLKEHSRKNLVTREKIAKLAMKLAV